MSRRKALLPLAIRCGKLVHLERRDGAPSAENARRPRLESGGITTALRGVGNALWQPLCFALGGGHYWATGYELVQ